MITYEANHNFAAYLVAALLCIVALSTCGRSDLGHSAPPPASGAATPLQEILILRAQRHYAPMGWDDGELRLGGRATQIVVPAELRVTYGNSANGYAYLYVDQCKFTYRGGSKLERPLKPFDPIQVELGRAYHYLMNDCASSTGERLTPMDRLKLRVEDGDRSMPTHIEVLIELARE